jgi:hypothetical protein
MFLETTPARQGRYFHPAGQVLPPVVGQMTAQREPALQFLYSIISFFEFRSRLYLFVP